MNRGSTTAVVVRKSTRSTPVGGLCAPNTRLAVREANDTGVGLPQMLPSTTSTPVGEPSTDLALPG